MISKLKCYLPVLLLTAFVVPPAEAVLFSQGEVLKRTIQEIRAEQRRTRNNPNLSSGGGSSGGGFSQGGHKPSRPKTPNTRFGGSGRPGGGFSQ